MIFIPKTLFVRDVLGLNPVHSRTRSALYPCPLLVRTFWCMYLLQTRVSKFATLSSEQKEYHFI